MVLQAAVDDSGKGIRPVFVLAGFVLSAAEWSAFADQWQDALDLSPRIEYFKMQEAWTFKGQFSRFSTGQRDERLQKLVSVILAHRPLVIREVIHHEHYERHFKGRIAKRMDYPYFLCVKNIIGLLIIHQLTKNWHPKEPVDFIFDEQGKEGDVIQRTWQFTVENIPANFKPLLGNRPIHRNEKDFLPLQAADLLAWYSRRFYAEKFNGTEYADPVWKALSELECVEYEWPEERIKWMIDGIRASGMIFEHDVKASPKLRKAFRRILSEKLKYENEKK